MHRPNFSRPSIAGPFADHKTLRLAECRVEKSSHSGVRTFKSLIRPLNSPTKLFLSRHRKRHALARWQRGGVHYFCQMDTYPSNGRPAKLLSSIDCPSCSSLATPSTHCMPMSPPSVPRGAAWDVSYCGYPFPLQRAESKRTNGRKLSMMAATALPSANDPENGSQDRRCRNGR